METRIITRPSDLLSFTWLELEAPGGCWRLLEAGWLETLRCNRTTQRHAAPAPLPRGPATTPRHAAPRRATPRHAAPASLLPLCCALSALTVFARRSVRAEGAV
jgi:hypothetical protein